MFTNGQKNLSTGFGNIKWQFSHLLTENDVVVHHFADWSDSWRPKRPKTRAFTRDMGHRTRPKKWRRFLRSEIKKIAPVFKIG
jgi:hypothetical protein